MRRGTVRHVDRMLIVTEPYFRSLETAARLGALARESGIPRLGVVANKVRTSQEEDAIRDFCLRHDLEVSALIPFDPEVTRADNAGLSLLDVAPGCSAAVAILDLSQSLSALEVA